MAEIKEGRGKSKKRSRAMSATKRKAGHGVIEEKTVNNEPPFRVRFPGERVVSSGSGTRYSFRQSKDPRLGAALRIQKTFFALYGIKDDNNGISEDESGDELVKHEQGCIKLRGGEKVIVVKSNNNSTSNNSAIRRTLVIDRMPRPYPMHSKAESERTAKKRERSWKKTFKKSVDSEAKSLKDLDCRCAREAIKFYNEKHSIDYEIVETLGSYGMLCFGHWFHCNFRARCKSDNDHGRRSSPKLFFAELFCRGGDIFNVKVCKILDGPGQRPHTVRGCKMCEGQLLHPVNGFEAGR